jgi:hypothetical protein
MSRSFKKRLEKLEKHLDQNGANCEFTIVFNPPITREPETEGQGGKIQRGSTEKAERPVQIDI